MYLICLQLRMAVHVALASNTTIAAGQFLPVTAIVSVNDDAYFWTGALELEIIAPEDQRNIVVS